MVNLKLIKPGVIIQRGKNVAKVIAADDSTLELKPIEGCEGMCTIPNGNFYMSPWVVEEFWNFVSK